MDTFRVHKREQDHLHAFPDTQEKLVTSEMKKRQVKTERKREKKKPQKKIRNSEDFFKSTEDI